jgi:uncharacterized membrane protein
MVYTSDIIMIFLGFFGFVLAFYIYTKKRAKKPLICPLRTNCETVITSKYSRIAGIPVEILGMLYYATVALFHAALVIAPTIATPPVSLISFILSATAVAFSFYLIAVQAFAIKQWCTWCIGSAILCISILSFTITSLPYDIIALLGAYKPIIVILHALAAGIGVGATTITDVFFFKFLKDYKISEGEEDVLHTMSQILWIALGVLIVTGVSLYLPNTEVLNQSSKFLLKVFVVGVITVNGIILNLVISPRLATICFGGEHNHHPGELHYLRRLAFACGAISITSWYIAFILGSIKKIALPTGTLVLLYIGVLLCAVIGSQIFDYFFAKYKTP